MLGVWWVTCRKLLPGTGLAAGLLVLRSSGRATSSAELLRLPGRLGLELAVCCRLAYLAGLHALSVFGADARECLDTTTGQPRSLFSIRADVYEQQAPGPVFRAIAARTDPQEWGRRVGLARLGPPETECAVRSPRDGAEAHRWRLELLRGAQRQVLLATAYWAADPVGKQFAQELVACAGRGVQVLLMLDNFGADSFVFAGPDPRFGDACSGIQELVTLMAAGGVQLCFWRRPTADCKNHTKMFAVDAQIGLVTDRNVGSAYFHNPAYSCSEVLVGGSTVVELATAFRAQWTDGGGAEFAVLRAEEPDRWSELLDGASAGSCRVLASDSASLASGMDPILISLIQAVRASVKSIDLRYAYTVLLPPLVHELVRALERGVKVRLITNSRATNDLWWVQSATHRSCLPMVQAGGQLITPRLQLSHVHAKVAVIDERVVLIGSWNAWHRSTFYEAELSLQIDSVEFGAALARENDMISSSEQYETITAAALVAMISSDPIGQDQFAELLAGQL